MQEVRRFKPSTVSRRMSVVTGSYRMTAFSTRTGVRGDIGGDDGVGLGE
jgi:hypothetical protein